MAVRDLLSEAAAGLIARPARVGLTVLGAWAATVPVVRTIAFAVAGFFIVASFVVIVVALGSSALVQRRRAAAGMRTE